MALTGLTFAELTVDRNNSLPQLLQRLQATRLSGSRFKFNQLSTRVLSPAALFYLLRRLPLLL